MRPLTQRNVYYIDLSKKVFKGYIETKISRSQTENAIYFKSTQLLIERISILGEDLEIIHKFLNTHSKDAFNQTHFANQNERNAIKNQDTNNKSNITEKINSSENLSINEDANAFDNSDSAFSNLLMVIIPDCFSKEEFTLRISFQPSIENKSLYWYTPVDSKDRHKELIAASQFGDSSGISPYIDSPVELELVYVVPNTDDIKVASSGEFKAIKEEDKNIIYLYKTYSNPKNIAFVIGSFEQKDIFNDTDKKRLFLPSPDIDSSELISDLQSVIKYISGFIKTDILNNISLVFSMIDIDELSGINIIFLRSNLIGGERDIEPCYIIKRILSDAFSHQIFGYLNWNKVDLWICHGLIGYLSDYCIYNLLGKNEFLFNYYEDKTYVIKNDVLEPPLLYTTRNTVDYNTRFFKTKSKLVFHCLEAHLSLAFIQKIAESVIDIKKVEYEHKGIEQLKRIVPGLESISGENSLKLDTTNSPAELIGNGIKISAQNCKCFTPKFIAIIKDITGKDLRAFFDFYVFKPGLLRIKLQFQIQKKKNSVNVTMTQSPTSSLNGSNKKHSGSILLKSYETEGNFDHMIHIDGENQFIYHTKPKKKKKDDAEEEEEEETMPLLYMRADPDKEHLFDFYVEQPDYMHIEQLNDKSVIGQIEAIEALRFKPTPLSCEALERIADNSHTFYKVRIKALYALRGINIEGFNGMQRLIQYFIRTRCVPNSTVLKANEFGLIQYFIQYHLIKAISMPSNLNYEDAQIVLSFLDNIIKFNDNSSSQFDDSWYMASVIENYTLVALHQLKLNKEDKRIVKERVSYRTDGDDFFTETQIFPSEYQIKKSYNNSDNNNVIKEFIEEIERFRIIDIMFPSNNNIISRACISSLIMLSFNGTINFSIDFLKSLSKYPNIFSLRIIAIEGLLILFKDTLSFVLDLLSTETPFIVLKVLDSILKILKSDLGFEKETLRNEKKKIEEIYTIYFFNKTIKSKIEEIYLFLEKKDISIEEYRINAIKNFNIAREEDRRNNLMRIVHKKRSVRLVKFDELRANLVEIDHIVRISKFKKPIIRISRDSYPKPSFKVRLKYKNFIPKNIDGIIFKLKLKQKKIKFKRRDIPNLIITKIREHHASSLLDDFIRRSKPTSSFDWTPLTTKKILDLVHENVSLIETYTQIEKMLIFVLSFNPINGKLYFNAKTVFNLLERLAFFHSFIPIDIADMSDDIRTLCEEFVDELLSNDTYIHFCDPVDFTELKNYLDIVRIPVCISDVKSRISEYGSFDCFIADVERIYKNCLNFNNVQSDIARRAIKLKDDVDSFKKNISPKRRDSYEILKEILEEQNSGEFFTSLLQNLRKVKTWGDFDTELNLVKKKYSRYSSNGKLCNTSVRTVRNKILNTFGVENSRLRYISE